MYTTLRKACKQSSLCFMFHVLHIFTRRNIDEAAGKLSLRQNYEMIEYMLKSLNSSETVVPRCSSLFELCLKNKKLLQSYIIWYHGIFYGMVSIYGINQQI